MRGPTAKADEPGAEPPPRLRMALTLRGATGDDLQALAVAMRLDGLASLLLLVDPGAPEPSAWELESFLWCFKEGGTLLLDLEAPPGLPVWRAPHTTDLVRYKFGEWATRFELRFALRCICPSNSCPTAGRRPSALQGGALGLCGPWQNADADFETADPANPGQVYTPTTTTAASPGRRWGA